MTDYGKEIKHRLIDLGKRQSWLIKEVHAETGLYFDGPYLARIMSGENNNPKITAAINKILEL